MVSINDVLKASKGLPVDDIFAQLWGRKLSGDYTIAVYTGTLPAVLTGTKAGYLHRYKVYGNVGENLFDKNAATEGYYFRRDGSAFPTTGGVGWFISEYISVDIGTYVASGLSKGGQDTYCCIYDENKQFIRSQLIVRNANVYFNIAASEKFVRLSVRDLDHEINTAMFTKGSTPPESYIPYEECGERTEQLFDKNAKNTANGYVNDSYLAINGSVETNSAYYISEYIDISDSSTITFSGAALPGVYCCFYDENKTITGAYDEVKVTQVPAAFNVPQNAKYIRLSVIKIRESLVCLTLGSTAPTSYIPYGYKLPLTSSSTLVDIYIGDDTLSTEEYVDSGTGKIYRMVGGVLTPVDPPVPFPQIPTTANSTTISWAGSGLAPSEVEFEYERRR